MAVYGQGSPGVRTKLRDASAITLVSNPNITAGVVGYSSKGELNKIIDLTSTADQDTLLGSGYNNPKFNQGLYAARAVVNAGGYVEYVRPYGEDIIEGNDENQALKTDTFLVEYDFSEGTTNSFDIDYFASTRYTTDGLGGKGSREIYTIAEALTENTNINFEIDADAQDDASGGKNRIPLFAIMNSDPTAANRAGDRFTISDIRVTDAIVTVKTSSSHGFSAGDEVTIVGTSEFNEINVVVSSTSLTSTTFQYTTTTATAAANETDGAVFRNEDTETSGVDYITVKTVATRKATKKYDYLKIKGGSNVILPDNSGDTFTVVDSDNIKTVLEFIDGGVVTDDANIGIDIVNDTFTTAYTTTVDDELIVTDATKFNVGDSVTLVEGGTLPVGLAASKDYLISEINSNILTIVANNGLATAVEITADGTGSNIIVNQTEILRNIQDGLVDIGYATSSNAKIIFDGSLVTTSLIKLSSGGSSNFNINDFVIINEYEDLTTGTILPPSGITSGTIYQIATVDFSNDTISLKTIDGVEVVMSSTPSGTFTILNLTNAKNSISLSDGYENRRLDIIGTFSLSVPEDIQDDMVSFVDINDSTALSAPGDTLNKTIATTTSIILDDSIGRTFLSLGLAIEDYQDINFDGSQDRVFTLTSEGESIAKIFLFVNYFFAGELYSFSGTITPHVLNDLNLDITAQAEAVENGWQFIINENIALENAILDSNFDLSQSIYNSAVTSEFTQVAFNADDPAIEYDAIWEYDPRNNSGSAMLNNAWQLFLDKDNASADMLVSAGTAVSNLFVKNLETINFTVMDGMLGICEKRKDLFAIFDGVDEAKITNALKKMVGIGSQGDIARWGALFDGRSIFYDSVYTKLNVEVVKSVEVAALITLNRAANVYWLPPAGYETGSIPAALSSRQKYSRSYNYADDATSDIARLYDANINPTRVNDQGQYIYGQKTMLKRTTALNRLNVIMLIAGIHKRFANFLDRKVFQLNTPSLRNGITSELQAQLELIKSANPAGLTEGIVICDASNNDADIIDSNQLIVDIFLQPTRTAEFITLRTTVQRTGDTATIVSATLIGG